MDTTELTIDEAGAIDQAEERFRAEDGEDKDDATEEAGETLRYVGCISCKNL